MEPSFTPGRGSPPSGTSWYCCSGRNGARLSRPGRGLSALHRGHMLGGSNGARPSRPGRARDALPGGDRRRRAAMEPGPHGREEEDAAREVLVWVRQPQCSPALTAGKRSFPGRRDPSGDRAAMEPGLTAGKRANSSHSCRATASGPQWSPALTAGKSPFRTHGLGIPGDQPQWSPALTAREEIAQGAFRMTRHRPQWSPALTAGKSGSTAKMGVGTNIQPQWSPALTAEKSRRVGIERMLVDQPQWSPALTAGKSRTSSRRSMTASPCRNGARPSRPGRAAQQAADQTNGVLAAMEPGPHGREESVPRMVCSPPSDSPQWSPALTAGKRAVRAELDPCRPRAAMEPGPHGREEPGVPGQGERLIRLAAVVREAAAMEPGPHGREEGHGQGATRIVDAAAMEPGPHGREESQPNPVVSRRRPSPQWSPALTAGKRRGPCRAGTPTG